MECQEQAFVSLTPSTPSNKNYPQTHVFILDILTSFAIITNLQAINVDYSRDNTEEISKRKLFIFSKDKRNLI